MRQRTFVHPTRVTRSFDLHTGSDLIPVYAVDGGFASVQDADDNGRITQVHAHYSVDFVAVSTVHGSAQVFGHRLDAPMAWEGTNWLGMGFNHFGMDDQHLLQRVNATLVRALPDCCPLPAYYLRRGNSADARALRPLFRSPGGILLP